ncbi:hypothetical protein [Aquimarina agarilytica]|uniref:hypothetical protein n=1 Tax=Aquimarina agarilytica TaxID=1087449 RepID=UPI0002891DE8|nr:hypothetical protein [Aquimarina agarilytica]
MNTTHNHIIQKLDEFIDQHRIGIVKYNLQSTDWWKGRLAILTKKYRNFCGEVIDKEALVCILYPMQYIRFNEVIHCGVFFVRDINSGVCIGGIDHYNLILTGKKIRVKEDWLISN